MLTEFFQLRYRALHEALVCIGLGLRDVRHAALWWRSALCSIAAVGLWLWLYYHFGAFFLQLSGMITLASVAGLLGLGVLDVGPGMAYGPATLSNMGSLTGMGGLLHSLLSIAQVALLALALASLIYGLVFLAGALGTLQLPARWWLLRRAQAVAARRYPTWQAKAPGPAARHRWRRAFLLLALLVPMLSMVVLLRLLVGANVHLLYHAAAAAELTKTQRRDLASAQRPAIFMLGLLLCMAMLVPVLNLLVPALLCSSLCHLQRRGWTGG